MKTKSWGAGFAMAACAFSLFAGFSSAQSNTDADTIRLELDRKQSEVLGQLRALDTVEARFSEYKFLRDNVFLGEKGITKDAENWVKKSQEWLKTWYTVFPMLEQYLGSPAGELQGKIEEFFQKQSTELAELRKLNEHIHALAGEGHARVSMVGKFESLELKEFNEHMDVINNQVEALKTAFNTMQNSFSEETFTKWYDMVAPTQKAVLAKMKTALLTYPELKKTLQKVEEAFEVENKIDPYVDKVKDLFDSFNAYLFRGQVFHADEALAQLKTEGQKSLQAIESCGLDAIFRNKGMDKVNFMLEEAEARYEEEVGSFGKPALLNMFVQEENEAIAQGCRDKKERLTLNCELFRTVGRLSEDQLFEEMNEDDLKFLEYSYDKIRKGPAL